MRGRTLSDRIASSEASPGRGRGVPNELLGDSWGSALSSGGLGALSRTACSAKGRPKASELWQLLTFRIVTRPGTQPGAGGQDSGWVTGRDTRRTLAEPGLGRADPSRAARDRWG